MQKQTMNLRLPDKYKLLFISLDLIYLVMQTYERAPWQRVGLGGQRPGTVGEGGKSDIKQTLESQ